MSVLSIPSFPSAAPAQLAPPSTGGILTLDRQLQSLSQQRRVLLIAAHPDDEDTELLALLSLGYGVQAAYLSLNRGEGGQNLIGQELGAGLGIIRSQELLAAREIDGAHQFFTRAFDYGFSRTLDEARRFWPEDSILKDVVRVIRTFRPHVIVSIFSGTARDGHGQHQYAGWITPLAFAAAGDASRFPELQREEGLSAWQPLKLYRSTRFDRQARTIALPTGRVDPRTGKSYHQIAMQSRSQHRSQDMGSLQDIGPEETGLALVESRVSTTSSATREASIFDGLAGGDAATSRLADSLRRVLSPVRLGEMTAPLAALVRRMNVEGANELSAAHGLATAAGLVLDAVATESSVVPGQTFDVEVRVYNSGTGAVQVQSIDLALPFGGRVEPAGARMGTIAAGEMASQKFSVTVADTAHPGQPYFLRRPLKDAMYDWSGAPAAVRGTPFQPPFTATAIVGVLGAPARLEREVTFRANDQAVGEIRRVVQVVPVIDVQLAPDQVVWPADGDSVRNFAVRLTHNGKGRRAGAVRLELSQGRSPAAQRYAFDGPGQARTFTFQVRRPATGQDTVRMRAVAEGDDGRPDTVGVDVIDYSHVRPTQTVTAATGEIRVAPIKLAGVRQVGYVRGASDRVPEALAEVGVPVTVLSARDLAAGDLSRFDAIVIGSRAYETDSALTRYNGRVLDYARNGGLVIVQYQQYAYIRGGYAGLPLTIASPHDRVTDETVPVTVLEPAHRALRSPNPVSAADWAGWPQERGLYFANTWDPTYQPLLEMHDPGMPPLRGGLLLGKLGEGTYVYTGLSFFRALPAGVPGAYKLFLNLLSLHSRGTL